MNAYVIGTGGCVPDRIVTNEELAPLLTIDAESIFGRTGIRNRRWARADTKTSDLAGLALSAALRDAKLDSPDLDYLIFGTMTPDRFIPGSATTIQSKLNLQPIPCLEIRNACCNAIYGLQVGSSLIASGTTKSLAICFAEVQSKYLSLDPASASITILFGDGGSAMILSDSPREGSMRFVDALIRSNGEYADALGIRAPGTEFSHPVEADYLPRMDGRVVIAEALRSLCEVSLELIERNGLSVKDISWMVPHQANANLLREVARKLNFPMEKIVSIVEDLGNTSSASMGLALHELRGLDILVPGEYILLPAFGSGFSWGAVLLETL